MNDGMERRDRSRAALLLAIGLLGAAWIIGASAMRIADARSTLSVTGSAKKQIRSDLAVWRGTFSSQASDITQAYAELERMRGLVRTYLSAQAFPDSELVFHAVTIRIYRAMTARGMETAAVSGYGLAQTVEVRSRSVDRVAALSREATELIRQGVPLESMPPEYLYTRISELKVEMLAEATKDARARATEMARNSGSRIGRLRSARMGVFQITPAFSTMVADYGINDTSSLLKDITAVVSLSFEIR
jgi:hypothetical protein